MLSGNNGLSHKSAAVKFASRVTDQSLLIQISLDSAEAD